MKKKIDLRRNADGTITAVCGTDRISFTPQPWWTQEEIFEHAKYSFMALGVEMKYDKEEIGNG